MHKLREKKLLKKYCSHSFPREGLGIVGQYSKIMFPQRPQGNF
jgi:hypothetical protein